jgi:hypothetical protein
MKLTTANIAVIMVAIVGVSIASTFAFTAEVIDYGKPASPAPGAMFLAGNVKVTHINGDGDVVGLRQSDNHIVQQGLEIIISQVFNQMNGTQDGIDTRPVSHMEIGHAGEWELLMNDTDLRARASIDVGAQCGRVLATFTNVTSSTMGVGVGHGRNTIANAVLAGNHAPCQGAMPLAAELGGANSAFCAAQANVTAQAQFTGANCVGALTIDEAGMFNGDTGFGTMFARNNFGGVVLNMPDTLQLDWEFTFTDS